MPSKTAIPMPTHMRVDDVPSDDSLVGDGDEAGGKAGGGTADGDGMMGDVPIESPFPEMELTTIEHV